jgi:5-methylcytosine-specific restriction endonuclease McrA
MPQKPSQRNYAEEYRKYGGTPKGRRENDRRKQARRDYETKHGNLPTKIEIDHIKGIKSGGTDNPKNLRAISRSKNRSKH